MIPTPRSLCPINRSLEMLGDQWSLLILRDIALHDQRTFRDLLTSNAEGISAPVLTRRLKDLTEAGFLTKAEVARGHQGRYSLTAKGISALPLLAELARFGAAIAPETAHKLPPICEAPEAIAAKEAELTALHLQGAA